MTRQKLPRRSVPNSTNLTFDMRDASTYQIQPSLMGPKEEPVTLSNRVLLEAIAPGQEWDVLVGPRLASVPCPCISTSPYSEEL